ncbi:recombinase family protein, partial [Clostridioides difficile]|nr:recombinase family protein [Clostridioides difficile]
YRLSLKDEKDNSKPENTLEHTLINLNKELDTLEKQKERLHDFLEQGIYDSNTFGERLKILLSRIENAREAINKTNIDI